MNKAAIIWACVNTALILALYFWMLFAIGDKPIILQRIQNIEQKVEQIDYGLQLIGSKDTIVINNYIQK